MYKHTQTEVKIFGYSGAENWNSGC